MTPADLNSRFAQPGLTFFEGPGGLTYAEIDNAGGVAMLCLQGAHIVSWRPKDQAEPVVWVSDAAKYGPGKSIRGGVPVCWPWFGQHATEAGFPGHGYARTVMWHVIETGTSAAGDTEIALTLVDTEQTRAQWPHPSRVELRASVGRALRIELATTNQGDQPFALGEALHTYFRIGDIGAIRVTGLEGGAYLDKVDGFARKHQDGAVTFAGEVDRVYVDTESECVIEDPELKRRIRVAKTGSRSTVIWTPWAEKAEKMGDFGPGRSGRGGWREMVCVESGNAVDNVVTVPAGQTHRMAVTYASEALV